MGRIEFNEEKHEYTYDGEKVPSVTELIAPLSAEKYGAINSMILQEAARRGKIVHALAEAVDYGLDLDTDEEAVEFAPYLEAYCAFLLDHDVEWFMSEEIVTNRRYEAEALIYAGTVDRFGMVDGSLAVVDIKTYASLGTDEQISASCQTALYRDAIIASWPMPEPKTEGEYGSIVKRYVLHLKKDGKYRLADMEKFDIDRGWNSGAVAWQLIDIWRHRQAVYKTGRKRKK